MTADPYRTPQPVELTEHDPLAALAKWVADGAVDEAARARAHQRSLERQAAEDATMAGLMVDLAEQQRPVMITTASGRRTRGPIVALGADFVAVREPRLGDVLVPFTSLSMVRTAPGDEAPLGTRPAHIALTFTDALLELSADQPDILASTGTEELRGEMRHSGIDLLAVCLEGGRRDVVHLATAAIDYVVVLAR